VGKILKGRIRDANNKNVDNVNRSIIDSVMDTVIWMVFVIHVKMVQRNHHVVFVVRKVY
jgi:hypothetical protein